MAEKVVGTHAQQKESSDEKSISGSGLRRLLGASRGWTSYANEAIERVIDHRPGPGRYGWSWRYAAWRHADARHGPWHENAAWRNDARPRSLDGYAAWRQHAGNAARHVTLDTRHALFMREDGTLNERPIYHSGLAPYASKQHPGAAGPI